jgi:hypothetical protein
MAWQIKREYHPTSAGNGHVILLAAKIGPPYLQRWASEKRSSLAKRVDDSILRPGSGQEWVFRDSDCRAEIPLHLLHRHPLSNHLGRQIWRSYIQKGGFQTIARILRTSLSSIQAIWQTKSAGPLHVSLKEFDPLGKSRGTPSFDLLGLTYDTRIALVFASSCSHTSSKQ